MLVVSRRIGEEILVPDHGIVFRVLEVRGSKVRIGITAPTDVRIQRRELWERIQSGEIAERTPLSADVSPVEVVLENGAVPTA